MTLRWFKNLVLDAAQAVVLIVGLACALAVVLR